jgi:hypothetical protein
MPLEAIRPRITGLPPNWDRLRLLAREFDVSVIALARRLIEVADEPTMILKAVVDVCCPGTIRQCHWVVSPGHRVLFNCPPKDEAEQLVRASFAGESYSPRVFVDNDECLLQWDCMAVKRPSKQYWFICKVWTSRSAGV